MCSSRRPTVDSNLMQIVTGFGLQQAITVLRSKIGMGCFLQHPKNRVFWARESVKWIFQHEHLGFSEALLWPFLSLLIFGIPNNSYLEWLTTAPVSWGNFKEEIPTVALRKMNCRLLGIWHCLSHWGTTYPHFEPTILHGKSTQLL